MVSRACFIQDRISGNRLHFCVCLLSCGWLACKIAHLAAAQVVQPDRLACIAAAALIHRSAAEMINRRRRETAALFNQSPEETLYTYL
jgi:hypothetical protein